MECKGLIRFFESEINITDFIKKNCTNADLLDTYSIESIKMTYGKYGPKGNGNFMNFEVKENSQTTICKFDLVYYDWEQEWYFPDLYRIPYFESFDILNEKEKYKSEIILFDEVRIVDFRWYKSFRYTYNNMIYSFIQPNEPIFGDFYNFILKIEFLPIKISLKIGFDPPPTNQPTLFIESQPLTGFYDIGETNFIVEYLNINNPGIKDSFANINTLDVLLGEGQDLFEKLGYIYKTYKSDLKIDTVPFIKNFLEYLLLRYLLSRLVFGKFDINYLRKRYYRDFLVMLNNRTYQNFLAYITSDRFKNYENFFKD